MKKEIGLWKKKLLDLSKRNPMLAFKDSKSATLEALSPDFNTIFKKITSGSELKVFEDAQYKSKKEDYYADDFVEESSGLTSKDYKEKFKDYISNDEILLYNRYNSPKKILHSLLLALYSELEEHGIYTLYMSFGFVELYDKESKTKMYSPLLLVPIDVNETRGTSKVTIKEHNDEIVLNPTLSYYLECEYKLKLDEFIEDEITIEEYLANVETKLKKYNLKLNTEIKISLLKFTKMTMYKDIDLHEDLIKSNDNIKAMLGRDNGKVFDNNFTRDINGMRVYKDQHNVLDCDSTQMEAIEYAKRGQSFVLQGPPGTGKSQTITNLIAEYLYEGKKVLFVSEKKAALDVVYRNLAKVGLSDYCLALHGTSVSKKDFINDIYESLNKGKQAIESTDIEKILSDMNKSKEELDHYVYDLHFIHKPIELSAYEMIERLAELRVYPDLEYLFEGIEHLGADYSSKVEDIITRFNSNSKFFGSDYRNSPFYSLRKKAYDYETKVKLKKILGSSIDILQKAINLDDSIQTDISNYNGLLAYSNIVRLSYLDDFFFDYDEIKGYVSDCIKLKDLKNKYSTLRNEVKEKYTDDLYKLDLDDLLHIIKYDYASGLKRLVSKKYKVYKEDLKNLAKNNKTYSYKTNIDMISKAIMVKNLEKEFNENNTLGFDINYDYDRLITDLNTLDNALHTLELKEKPKDLKDIDTVDECIFNLNSIENPINDYFAYDFKENDFVDMLEDIEYIFDDMDSIDHFMSLLDILDEAKENRIYDFIQMLLDKGFNQEDYIGLFKKTFYLQWLNFVENKTSLKKLTRAEHDKLILEFQKDDRLSFKINRAKVIEKVSSSIPDPETQISGSPAKLIMREHEKKRKQMTVKALMDNIPDTIQTIKPCFLMSPLTVSTYLNPEKIHFDVTIFDEASQVFPEDAIGAIYRADNLIVVGDSKQMPPTSFFNANNFSEDIEFDNDADAFESILHMCRASMPQLSLGWHYRSKVEELISFSNKNFYDSKLISFPTTSPRMSGYGVELKYVEDGIYNQALRTNEREAEVICDLIYEHAKKYPNRSIGVIAFSVAQQNKILNTLMKRRSKNPEIDDFFAKFKEEPFFVKNLETVQGDERDTIIFSVCYGKTADGKFRQNFGPLTSSGGERRLNVAVTRAKYNLVVVSSIKSSDIDPSKNTNLGPILLHDYLEFAEFGLQNDGVSFAKGRPFEEEVKAYIESEGYSCDTNVGCSGYKIDIAVKDKTTGEYVMAVECDGLSYKNQLSSRDRDRLRQDVLERNGFKYYRVWASDWNKHNNAEREALLEAVRQAFRHEEVEAIDDTENYNVEISEVKPKKTFDNYHTPALKMLTLRSFPEAVNKLILANAPISQDLIIKELLYLFDASKLTPQIRSKFNFNYNYLKDLRITLGDDGFYYTEECRSYKLRVPSAKEVKRDIKTISLVELGNGLYDLIEKNVKLDKQDLYLAIVKELGYRSLTETLRDRLDAALDLIKDHLIFGLESVSINPENKLVVVSREL